MTDLDTLLSQALALVSEDKRGELADVIEEIVTTTRREALADVYAIVCKWCRAGRPIAPTADDDWLHPSLTDDPNEWEWCQAGYMRRRMAWQEAAPHAP